VPPWNAHMHGNRSGSDAVTLSGNGNSSTSSTPWRTRSWRTSADERFVRRKDAELLDPP